MGRGEGKEWGGVLGGGSASRVPALACKDPEWILPSTWEVHIQEVRKPKAILGYI